MVRRVFSLMLAAAFMFCGMEALAQDGTQTYTGTVLSYGTGRNVRTRTNTFTLRINGTTSAAEYERALAVLQEGGQDDLLAAVRKNDLGNFSYSGQLGRKLHLVGIDTVDGKRRIRAIFERWMHFSELRGGYRSVDYPFGYLELLIDPETGEGEGTLIEAAQINWRRDKKSNQYVVEVENFATWPAKLLGVSSRG